MPYGDDSLEIFPDTRKILYLRLQLLDKFRSHPSVITGNREFNINESTVYIKVSLNRNTHKTRVCTD